MADHPFDEVAVCDAMDAYDEAMRFHGGNAPGRCMRSALTAACKSMRERGMAMVGHAVWGSNASELSLYQYPEGETSPVTIIRHKEQP